MKKIEELEKNKIQVIISSSISLIIGVILILITYSNISNIKTGVFFILLPFGLIGIVLVLYGVAIIIKEIKSKL